jgi:hypothetical protein
MEVPAMVSRLRVSTGGVLPGLGDTPVMICVSRVAGHVRKFASGRREDGLSAPEVRYNTHLACGRIQGRSRAYHVIPDFRKQKVGPTMTLMHARAP